MFHLPKSVLCLLLLGVFQFSSFEAKALPPASTAVYEWRPELGGVLDTSTNLVWGYSLRNSMNQNAGFTGANTYVPANYAVMLAGESVNLEDRAVYNQSQADALRATDPVRAQLYADLAETQRQNATLFLEASVNAGQYSNWRMPTRKECTAAWNKGFFTYGVNGFNWDTSPAGGLQDSAYVLNTWTSEKKGTKLAYRFSPIDGSVSLIGVDSSIDAILVRTHVP